MHMKVKIKILLSELIIMIMLKCKYDKLRFLEFGYVNHEHIHIIYSNKRKNNLIAASVYIVPLTIHTRIFELSRI